MAHSVDSLEAPELVPVTEGISVFTTQKKTPPSSPTTVPWTGLLSEGAAARAWPGLCSPFSYWRPESKVRAVINPASGL